MQPGFASKSAKKQARKKAARQRAKKKAAAAGDGGDAMMGEAGTSQQAQVDGAECEMQEAGQKLSHREKTDMKRALKLRVKQLKTTRVKQTKLGKAGKGPHTNKKAKKEASASIKALIAEQQKLGSKA